MTIANGPGDYHRWRIGLTLGQLRRELAVAMRDVGAVARCRLLGRHRIEPDQCGEEWNREHGVLTGIAGPDGPIWVPAPTHDWCPNCGWCVSERERRSDLVGVPCEERGDDASPGGVGQWP